jgi:NADH:ubiquinone oxidoreductase subunit 6 (subunit J)
MNILNISQISLFGTDLLIDMLYILTIFFGISVLVQKNAVVSIIYFMLIYVSTSLYLYYNGYYGMPLLLILIYVGAIAILFLFILTLINVKEQESDALHVYNNNNFIIIINLLIFILLCYNINTVSTAIVGNTSSIAGGSNLIIGTQLYNILDNIILLNISDIIINDNLFNLYFNIPASSG